MMKHIYTIVTAVFVSLPLNVAFGGQEMTVSVDTLIKTAYCLGSDDYYINSMIKTLNEPSFCSQNQCDENLKISETKNLNSTKRFLNETKEQRRRRYSYLMTFSNILANNTRQLILDTKTSGFKDTDRCQNESLHLCKNIWEKNIPSEQFWDVYRECQYKIPVCLKLKACDDAGIPFGK